MLDGNGSTRTLVVVGWRWHPESLWPQLLSSLNSSTAQEQKQIP
jgi:hypothetical protein